MAAAITAASSLTVSSSLSKTKTPLHASKPVNLPFPVSVSLPCKNRLNRTLRVVNSISVSDPGLRTGPDDLVSSILSKVRQTDGGLSLTKEQHKEVAEVARELQKYCVKEPVKCPLIFGGKLKVLDSEWIQVIFEPPVLKIGGMKFKYGFESEVKLQISYIDEKIRLGKGSKGSLFVFQRRQ
ncbi:probable plastid-lipid-associated protein 8, chloroplastic [Carica papaya]|uniref:probable plastid-lipid-associated protein 8, chloroplastic n=1 Tax=Carica papaya TaxID=3649 RepID=UPI000B8CE5FA|nr:probable plastid-lipid-associated protein 8, chloroplastic [Carica papaya]